VADIEQTQKLAIYNLEGPSNSRSVQLDFTFEPADGWELKYAHKWNITETTYNIETDSGLDYITKQAPFIPKHRSLVQVYYTAWQKKWDINITLQNVGPSRVPSQGDIEEFWSDSFKHLDGQITRRFKKLDWYIGVENALNYMQPNPIRGVENPFSDNFDAGMIWGPVMGTKWFTGIRLNMNN
jgi:outer membrane receptor protein involved in Fe transport